MDYPYVSSFDLILQLEICPWLMCGSLLASFDDRFIAGRAVHIMMRVFCVSVAVEKKLNKVVDARL